MTAVARAATLQRAHGFDPNRGSSQIVGSTLTRQLAYRQWRDARQAAAS